MKKIILVLLTFLLASLVACNVPANDTDTANTADTGIYKDKEEMLTDRDESPSYNEDEAIKITLHSTYAASTSDRVEINEGVIKITQTGCYLVTGSLENGMLIVDAPQEAKIQIILRDVSIKSESSAPIYIKSCNKCFLTLEGGSVLETKSSFVNIDENNIDGTIFSKDDLTINGDGSLSLASIKNGIVCKDDLVISGATLSISAQNHAIDVNNSARLSDCTLESESLNDGIHAENTDDSEKGYIYLIGATLKINASGDGLDAGAYAQIEDCQIDITTNSSENSTKGIKAETGILISGGKINISSYDDAIHSNSSLIIKAGELYLSSNDDGIHADEIIEIYDGQIEIINSYEGIEALDIKLLGGSISIKASDDGINAAGGNDQSGFGGQFGAQDNFGRPGGRPGGMGGMGGMGGSSSDGSITISGGTIYINASGDGIDANGTLEITGGNITVCGPTSGDTAVLDFDVSGTITGGTFVGTGSSMMAQTLSGTTQGVISLSVGSQTAGTKIILEDESGQKLFEVTPENNYQIVILTSDQMVKGESYTIYVGDLSGTFEAE
ncbi:MAG: carbohydrate-binding domain-containing protein [Clostridia bacterium]|nr:carbohydrate-binding domain-containing protein [Clostridia bacterium]